MNLLLVNDDGINAEGIKVLAKELEKYHKLTIVAPADQQSATGHSITITTPLIVKELKLEGINAKAYSVYGTPADCVRIALDKLIDCPIDMVVSGINRGVNLGNDILYSGTVSAAIEAAMNKIPSLAVSVFVNEDTEKYDVAAKYAIRVIKQWNKSEINNEVVLNLNVPLIPQEEIKGIKVCKIGGSVFESYFIEKIDENGQLTFTLEGNFTDVDEIDTDIFYLKSGYVTLTPLHYDLTNFNILKDVEQLIK